MSLHKRRRICPGTRKTIGKFIFNFRLPFLTKGSARYFFAAEHQLSKERGAVRLASVQARLLQCFYLLTQSRINHCWNLFGTLSHLAFAIGLHRTRKCDRDPGNVDYVEVESRRRLFWTAYSLDKYLAAALGRPRTFKDEDIDQVHRSHEQTLIMLILFRIYPPSSMTTSSPPPASPRPVRNSIRS